VNAALEPAGCLGDLGWYNIRIALWATELADCRAEVSAGQTLAQTDSGVPTGIFRANCFSTLAFPAGLYCSFVNFRQQWVNVSGAKGYLQFADFVNPLRQRTCV
jgi:hypothetical protein